MILAQCLSKKFSSIQAVNDVSLHIQPGEIFGLVGPDGAGKTTLIRMVCDLIQPDSGTVLLAGLPPTQADKMQYGYMPQKFSLYPDLTVMENIRFFGSLYSIPWTVIQERADEILHTTNLIDFKQRLADQLSGGMKQKLALTCALITRPKLLVLDEPTYGVDPESRKEFWTILYQLNYAGMTIMLSTPYMDEAELCHRVALINEGRLISVDTPAVLKSSFGRRVRELRADSKDPHLFEGVPGIAQSSHFGYKYHVLVEPACETDHDFIPSYLAEKGITLLKQEEIMPTMEDVFAFLAENG